jgi:hypothetical protein
MIDNNLKVTLLNFIFDYKTNMPFQESNIFN